MSGATVRNPANFPDNVWHIVGRETPRNIHESVNGVDCYVFARRGGERLTDLWSITYRPVATFWPAT